MKNLSFTPTEKADTVLYIGCTPASVRNDVALASAELLHRAGKRFTLLGEREVCCGVIAKRLGAYDEAREQAKRNISTLKGAEEVIFPCPACYSAHMQDYNDLEVDLPFKSMHISEVLNRSLSDGELDLGELNRKVAYHDPCNLGRGMNMYDEPRRILQAIPGLELVEMYPTRSASWCCGGEHMGVLYPRLAQRIAREKISLAIEAGAETLVTACPLCLVNLKDAAQAEATPRTPAIQVCDITEILLESTMRAR